jgi:transposase
MVHESARGFRPTWTQADYQKVKKVHYRHRLMTKVVDSVLASGLSYSDVAQRAHVATSTVHAWVSVLEALNMEMVLVTRKEAQDHTVKKDAPHVRIKRVTAS